MRTTALALVFTTAIAGTAGAAEVTRSATVDADAAQVWDLVGPFCSISDWYPGIATCAEEDIDGRRHRRLVGDDGAVFLEAELAHDDETMSYGYAIVESPLPVEDYEATFSVSEADGKAVLTWTSTFEPVGVSEEEATDVVGGIYDAGLDAVKEHFAE